MAFKKGQSGNPGGRPTEGKSKAGIADNKLRAAIIDSGQSPLEFLMGVYQNQRESKSYRMQAAIACLPYVHRKMPTEVEAGQRTVENLVQGVRDTLAAIDRDAEETAVPEKKEGDEHGVE